MRPKLGLRLTARFAVAVLASCTAVTGIDKLTVDDDGNPIDVPDGGEIVGSRDGGGDGASPEGAAEGDSSIDIGNDSGASCDEPGLVAYWRLDEGKGFDVRDCSGNKLDGKMRAGTWVQGKKGFALAFDGGFAGFGDSPLLNKTGAFTAMAWVRPEAYDAGGLSQYIVGKTAVAGNNGWRLAAQGSQYAVAISGEGGSQTFGGSVGFGQWVHVTAVYIPGTAVELYVDGQLLTRNVNARSAALVATTEEFRIGTKGDGGYPFTGAIDDVRLYDRALSAAEIAARAAP